MLSVLRNHSGKAPIMIVVIAVAVICLGLAGFAFMKMGKSSGPTKEPGQPWKFPDFTVTLSDAAEPHYLKTCVVLVVHGKPKAAAEGEGGVSMEEASAMDAINRILARKHYAELLQEKGKTELKSELKSGLNGVLKQYDIEVEDVLFTSFALQ